MDESPASEAAWHCLQTQPKKEHLAAAQIHARVGVECFCPRITFKKKTRAGQRRFTEALFPGYLFVKCDIREHLRHLMAQQGVRGVVSYGDHIPPVPEAFIEEIRERLGGELHEAQRTAIEVGDEVLITEGPFADWHAVVSGQVPGVQRVRLLLEFLGRQISVDVDPSAIQSTREDPKRVARRSDFK